MRINGEQLTVESETEALAISSVLLGLDNETNKGKLPADHEHRFTGLALDFEPPLPIERLSTARLTGRRILDRYKKQESTEYVLEGDEKIKLFGNVLALAMMPKNLLSRGPRLGKKRYLRDNKVRPLYDYLRQAQTIED